MDFDADAAEALTVIKDTVPPLVNDVPALKPLVPFLPLIGILLHVVDANAKVGANSSTGDAVADAATALRFSMISSADTTPITNAHAQAAGNAADSGSTDAVLAALAALPSIKL